MVFEDQPLTLVDLLKTDFLLAAILRNNPLCTLECVFK